jgi:hypothetical protein
MLDGEEQTLRQAIQRPEKTRLKLDLSRKLNQQANLLLTWSREGQR